MIPCGSILPLLRVPPSISQQRGHTDLRWGDTGLTNLGGVTEEEVLVWPSWAVGLLC